MGTTQEYCVQFLKILEVTPEKTVAGRSSILQTIKGKRVRQGRTHKRRSFIETYTWMRQCWVTSNNLHQLCADIGYILEDLSGAMYDGDKWPEMLKKLRAQKKKKKKNQTINSKLHYP